VNKILSDKDFTKEDSERIAARKKARKGAPYMLSVGRRRMEEIAKCKK
jgi:hypothetical protein